MVITQSERAIIIDEDNKQSQNKINKCLLALLLTWEAVAKMIKIKQIKGIFCEF